MKRLVILQSTAVALCAVATVGFAVALLLRDVVNVWLSTSLTAGSILLAVYIINPRLLRFQLPKSLWLFGVASGVLMAGLTWLLFPWIAQTFPQVASQTRQLYAISHQSPGPYMSLPLLMLIVYAEEIVWRRIITQHVLKKQSAIQILMISSLLYALPQIFSGLWLLACVAFVCGIVWTAIALYAKDVAPSYFSHLTWNILVMVLFPVI